MTWGDWQDKEREFARNADVKRRIVAEAQRLAQVSDFKGAGAQMKQLSADFKAAGFAGKGTNDELWNAFNSARGAFYERQKAMEQAVRDQEVVVQRAEEHYQRVRAKGSGFGLLPNKQAVDLEKARTHERIEREKLEDLRRRYKELWLKGH